MVGVSLSPQDLVSGKIPGGPLPCENEQEFRCRRCNSRCTRSPTSDLEYGHKTGCPRRPDHFPYAEGANYDPAEDPLLDDDASPEIVTDGGQVKEDETPALLKALRAVADRPHLEPYQGVTVKPFETCFIPAPDGPAVELTYFDGSTVRPVGFVEPQHAETDADLHQSIKYTAEQLGLGGDW